MLDLQFKLVFVKLCIYYLVSQTKSLGLGTKNGEKSVCNDAII